MADEKFSKEQVKDLNLLSSKEGKELIYKKLLNGLHENDPMYLSDREDSSEMVKNIFDYIDWSVIGNSNYGKDEFFNNADTGLYTVLNNKFRELANTKDYKRRGLIGEEDSWWTTPYWNESVAKLLQILSQRISLENAIDYEKSGLLIELIEPIKDKDGQVIAHEGQIDREHLRGSIAATPDYDGQYLAELRIVDIADADAGASFAGANEIYKYQRFYENVTYENKDKDISVTIENALYVQEASELIAQLQNGELITAKDFNKLHTLTTNGGYLESGKVIKSSAGIAEPLYYSMSYKDEEYHLFKVVSKPFVIPWYNFEAETYLSVRGEDAKMSALTNKEKLNFTRKAKTKNEEENNVVKWIRLLMPQYKRKVEVEDLDRNFWVIGQVIAGISATLFDDNGAIGAMIKGLLKEIGELWENVLFLWSALAMLSQKRFYKDVHTEVVVVNAEDLYLPLQYDFFESSLDGLGLNELYTKLKKKFEYLVSTYTNHNLCILPAIRVNNYEHNYYGKVLYPFIMIYDRNEDGNNWSMYKFGTGYESGITIQPSEYKDMLYALHEDEDTYTYLYPFSKALDYAQQKDTRFYALIRDNISLLCNLYRYNDVKHIYEKDFSLSCVLNFYDAGEQVITNSIVTDCGDQIVVYNNHLAVAKELLEKMYKRLDLTDEQITKENYMNNYLYGINDEIYHPTGFTYGNIDMDSRIIPPTKDAVAMNKPIMIESGHQWENYYRTGVYCSSYEQGNNGIIKYDKEQIENYLSTINVVCERAQFLEVRVQSPGLITLDTRGVNICIYRVKEDETVEIITRPYNEANDGNVKDYIPDEALTDGHNGDSNYYYSEKLGGWAAKVTGKGLIAAGVSTRSPMQDFKGWECELLKYLGSAGLLQQSANEIMKAANMKSMSLEDFIKNFNSDFIESTDGLLAKFELDYDNTGITNFNVAINKDREKQPLIKPMVIKISKGYYQGELVSNYTDAKRRQLNIVVMNNITFEPSFDSMADLLAKYPTSAYDDVRANDESVFSSYLSNVFRFNLDGEENFWKETPDVEKFFTNSTGEYAHYTGENDNVKLTKTAARSKIKKSFFIEAHPEVTQELYYSDYQDWQAHMNKWMTNKKDGTLNKDSIVFVEGERDYDYAKVNEAKNQQNAINYEYFPFSTKDDIGFCAPIYSPVRGAGPVKTGSALMFKGDEGELILGYYANHQDTGENVTDGNISIAVTPGGYFLPYHTEVFTDGAYQCFTWKDQDQKGHSIKVKDIVTNSTVDVDRYEKSVGAGGNVREQYYIMRKDGDKTITASNWRIGKLVAHSNIRYIYQDGKYCDYVKFYIDIWDLQSEVYEGLYRVKAQEFYASSSELHTSKPLGDKLIEYFIGNDENDYTQTGLWKDILKDNPNAGNDKDFVAQFKEFFDYGWQQHKSWTPEWGEHLYFYYQGILKDSIPFLYKQQCDIYDYEGGIIPMNTGSTIDIGTHESFIKSVWRDIHKEELTKTYNSFGIKDPNGKTFTKRYFIGGSTNDKISIYVFGPRKNDGGYIYGRRGIIKVISPDESKPVDQRIGWYQINDEYKADGDVDVLREGYTVIHSTDNTVELEKYKTKLNGLKEWALYPNTPSTFPDDIKNSYKTVWDEDIIEFDPKKEVHNE